MALRIMILAVSLLSLTLSSCKGPLVATPLGHGNARRSAIARMVANPEAVREEPKVGVASSTAEGVMENYKEAEKTKNQVKRIDRQSSGIGVEY